MPRRKKARRSSPVAGKSGGGGKSWKAIVAWSKTWPEENPGESSEITQNVLPENTEMIENAAAGSVEVNQSGNIDSGVGAEVEVNQIEREDDGGDSGSDIQFVLEVPTEPVLGGGRSLTVQEMKQKMNGHQEFLASSAPGIGPKNQPQMQGNRASKRQATASSSSANANGSVPARKTTANAGQTVTLLQVKNELSKVVSEKFANLAEVLRKNGREVAAIRNAQNNVLGGLNRLNQRFDTFALQSNLVRNDLEQLKTEIRALRTERNHRHNQQDSGTPTPSLPERVAKRKADSSGMNANKGSGKRANVLVTETKATQCGTGTAPSEVPAAEAATLKGTTGNETTRQALSNIDTSVSTPSDSRMVPPPTGSCSSSRAGSYVNLRSGRKKKARYGSWKVKQ